MGTKYIVELEDGEHLYKTTINALGNPVMRSAEKVPYTEPDLEQVRKEAYGEGYQSGREDLNIVMSDVEQAKADAYLKGLNDGQGVILAQTQNNAFNNGYKKCLEDMEQVRKEERDRGYDDGYHQGLSDAWDAARRIVRMPEGDLLNVFTECYSAVCTALQVILKYDAPEAIEKLRDYEQDEKIKVGDEVEDGVANIIVTEINNDGTVTGLTSGGSFVSAHVRQKTGRHFPEVAAFLEKMRGEQDG